jgi:imidazole glycerol-phosphate synthase subunit HisH
MTAVGIIDYGINNLISVKGAVEAVGGKAIVTADPQKLAQTGKLILPGVGAFGQGIRNLERSGLWELLENLVIERHAPILGICLGAHLMLETSSEAPGVRGLGWIQGEVLPLDPAIENRRAQHVGWNEVTQRQNIELWEGIPNDAHFYFVHGFHMVPTDNQVVAADFSFGREYCAAICKDNIFSTQFHPEKSQLFGLRLIKNFVEL